MAQQAILLDDGTLTTLMTAAMIQALIPLGLKAVEEALLAKVTALAGTVSARRRHTGDRPLGEAG